MNFFLFLLWISVFSAISFATQFNVTVGKDELLSFDPSTLTDVQTGDIVKFTFVSNNHSVIQSSFNRPCHPRLRGANSGFRPVDTNTTEFPEFSIHIDNTSAPLWFFCAQTGHCQAGMVFAINPTENATFDDFLATAHKSANTSSQSTNTAIAPSPTRSSSHASARLHLPNLTPFLVVVGFVIGLAL